MYPKYKSFFILPNILVLYVVVFIQINPIPLNTVRSSNSDGVFSQSPCSVEVAVEKLNSKFRVLPRSIQTLSTRNSATYDLFLVRNAAYMEEVGANAPKQIW